MTFVPVVRALLQSYPLQQVLTWLNKNDPKTAKIIKSALKQGYTEDQISDYLLNQNQMSFGQKNEALSGMTDKEKTEKLTYRGDQVPGNLGNIAQTALSLYGGYQLGKNVLNRTSPSINMNSAQQTLPSPLLPPPQMTPNPAIPIPPQSISNPLGQQIPAIAGAPNAQQPVQTLTPPPIQINASDLSEKYPVIHKVIDNLRGQNDENQIAAFLQKFSPGDVAKAEKEFGKPIIEIIKEYVSTQPQNVQTTPNQTQIPLNVESSLPQLDVNTQKARTPLQTEKSPELVEKEKPSNGMPNQKLAVLPNGDLAHIKSIKGKIAKLDVDGKNKLMNLSKIIESPLPEKDLADLYDELMAAIPESEKSAAIQWAGYDENNNQLSYIPHGGALYTYENIPAEWVEKLKGSMFKAKTTGETTEGMWFAGGESRGAGLYQLIQELQKIYGGKGKEYSSKSEPVFDAFRPGREASRAKKKRSRDEEKKEKRKK